MAQSMHSNCTVLKFCCSSLLVSATTLAISADEGNQRLLTPPRGTGTQLGRSAEREVNHLQVSEQRRTDNSFEASKKGQNNGLVARQEKAVDRFALTGSGWPGPLLHQPDSDPNGMRIRFAASASRELCEGIIVAIMSPSELRAHCFVCFT